MEDTNQTPKPRLRHAALMAAALLCCLAPVSGAGEPVAEDSAARLQSLLQQYYAREADAAQDAPTAAELRQRREAGADAERFTGRAYHSDSVRLSGAEGSLVLAEFSRRLADPGIPESRREMLPVCSIRTSLLGKLIAGEQRSFEAVGKYQYLLTEYLQPGATTIRLSGYSWAVDIPEDSPSRQFVITLYSPPGETPQLHVFPAQEFLVSHEAHVPAWLPERLNLRAPG